MLTAALLLFGAAATTRAQTTATTAGGQEAQESFVAAGDAPLLVRQLGDREARTRQLAAEKLARLAAAEQLRLVEGYRLQEKDSRVRLALDWALYRMGKSQTLFEVVRALDSSRAEQALSYLAQLETPDPLYVFLKRVNGNTQIKLLEALARVGDAGTLEQIKPYQESLDPVIADAAKFAEREITIRLEEKPAPDEATRPRQVGSKPEDEP